MHIQTETGANNRTQDWFDSLPTKKQKEYLRQHPHSKYWGKVRQTKSKSPKDVVQNLNKPLTEAESKGIDKIVKSEHFKPDSRLRARAASHIATNAKHLEQSVSKLGKNVLNALKSFSSGNTLKVTEQKDVNKAAKVAFYGACALLPGGLFVLALHKFMPKIINSSLDAVKKAQSNNPIKSLTQAITQQIKSGKFTENASVETAKTTSAYSGNSGFYMSGVPSEYSKENLTLLCTKLNLPCNQTGEFHVTVMYSPENAVTSLPIASFPITARLIGLEYFGKESEVLVATLDCPELHRLHARCKHAGAVPTYPTYKPHITLCDPAPNLDLVEAREFLANNDIKLVLVGATYEDIV